MVWLSDAYGWSPVWDDNSLADCWILIYIIQNGDRNMSEQRYKERICEEVKKIDDLEMLQFIWKILRNLREDEKK